MNARELALDLFLEAEKSGAYIGELVRETLDKYDYEDPREKAFLKRLTESTLEHGIALDWALNACSSTPVDRMKPFISHLLRLSACQILYLDHVPDRAACSEAVKIAKKRGFSSLSGFVNGVLRALCRNKERLEWPDRDADPVRFLSVRHNVPEWMIGMWIEQYGARKTEEILQGLAVRRPVTIRFSESVSRSPKAEACLQAIEKKGVAIRRHPLWPDAWELIGCGGVASLPGYAEGLFYVQDVGGMLAVASAGILPGMRVLDLCSAPGGKALLASEYAGATGTVLAGDLSQQRIERMKENIARMGVGNVRTRQWDACVTQEGMEEWADVLLADVPCSGLGVMGRKKEIRYRIRPEDLSALSALQRQILSASWRYVKKGGVLLYSTCTINRQENEAIVKELTERYPFVTESLDMYLPEQLWNEQTKKGMLQLWPGVSHTDGFFMARLRRIDKED